MSYPLDDCRERVTRAREHLVDITRSVQEFLARNPYRLVQRDDPQTGGRVLPVQVREDSPKLATRVGEMAQHLRSALDYLSYQLVLANGETPTNATEFPIFLEVNGTEWTRQEESEAYLPKRPLSSNASSPSTAPLRTVMPCGSCRS